MAQLVFRAAARRDVADLARYIETQSASRAVATAFIDRLLAHCRHLADLSGTLGRARPDLGDFRSAPFGNYVIFFRYGDEAGLRSHFYIVRILHRARDADAVFGKERDQD